MTADTALIVLTFIAVLAVPALVYFRLRASLKTESERLMAKLEESLGASVKLLEVRNYYEQMSGELKKMLDEAYKEGNRFRQDHLRRMIERLEQLKARTLDRTTKLLENENAGRNQQRRRRHRGRHGGQGQQQQGRPQGQGQQGRPQGQPQPRGPQPPRPQQPPRQEPPKPQPPPPLQPRDEKPPATDPRAEQSPSPFEE